MLQRTPQQNKFCQKRIPVAGIAAVVLIIGTELVFLARTEPLTGWPVFELTTDDAVYVVRRDLLERAPGRVVLVGDSSCMIDLVPAEMQPGAGSVINLGTIINMTPAGFTVLAQEALEQEPAPRAIVLAMLPQAFETTVEQAVEWGQLGRYLVAYSRTSPLYEVGSDDVLSWFYRKHRFNVFPPELGGSFPVFATALVKADGNYPEYKTYTGTKFVRDEFKPTPFARAALRLLVQSARSRGVPVILWLNPSPNDSVTSNYMDRVDEYVEQLRREEPDLLVPQTKTPTEAINCFATVTHLNPETAKVHSRAFAKVLKKIVDR